MGLCVFSGMVRPLGPRVGGRRRFRSLEVLQYGDDFELPDGVSKELDFEQVQVFGSRF